jgi:hypothetical protein
MCVGAVQVQAVCHELVDSHFGEQLQSKKEWTVEIEIFEMLSSQSNGSGRVHETCHK